MAIICIAILFIMDYLPTGKRFDGLRILVVVPVAVIVYIYAAKLLKNEMLSLFYRHKKNAG